MNNMEVIMKIKNIILIILLSCFIFNAQAKEFDYQLPNPQMVERIVSQINRCKDALNGLESSLKDMEASPNNFSSAEYKSVKNMIRLAKSCLTESRKKLNTFSKTHTKWFNSPNSFADIGIRDPYFQNMLDVMRYTNQYRSILRMLGIRFNKLAKPGK